MGAPVKGLKLTEEEASTLKMLVSAGTSEQRTVIRARVVLAAAEGMTRPEIAGHTYTAPIESCATNKA